MSIFEYVMVLMSIVLGFGMTSNLRAISRLKLEDRHLDSFVLLGYYVAIMILQLDYWLTIWTLSVLETWTLLDISIWLYLVLVLFLAGAYLDRSTSDDEGERRFTRKAALIAMVTWTIGALITVRIYFGLPFYSPVHFALYLFVAFTLLGLSETKPYFRVISSLGWVAFSLFFLLGVGDSQIIVSTGAGLIR